MPRRTPLLAASMLSFLLCAGVAVAGDDVFVGAGGQCPERARSASVSDEVAVTEDASKPQSARVEGGGGDAAVKPVRNRPRWQSYLPGMMR
ncbi:MAG: hypothetical protein KDJ14_15315 [Xanthomonadales bacterium]|nr:hypothetical protein [Xanthomonadales bacterium]